LRLLRVRRFARLPASLALDGASRPRWRAASWQPGSWRARLKPHCASRALFVGRLHARDRVLLAPLERLPASPRLRFVPLCCTPLDGRCPSRATPGRVHAPKILRGATPAQAREPLRGESCRLPGLPALRSVQIG
jgi:hypothetical protein